LIQHSKHIYFSIDGTWQLEIERRNFFDEFAKEKGLHPLDVESWYSVKYRDVTQKKARTKSYHSISELCAGWKQRFDVPQILETCSGGFVPRTSI
jgi:hypothetical protein